MAPARIHWKRRSVAADSRRDCRCSTLEERLANSRMQATGKAYPELRSAAASLADACEREFVRRGPEALHLCAVG